MSLQSLVSKLPPNILSPVTLTKVIELAATAPSASSSSDPPGSSKALKLARKYTTSPKFVLAGTDAQVWLARLNVERSSHAADEQEVQGDLLKVWADARKSATGAEADVVNVWLWGVPLSRGDRDAETLLPDSLDKRVLFDVSANVGRSFTRAPNLNVCFVDCYGSRSCSSLRKLILRQYYTMRCF